MRTTQLGLAIVVASGAAAAAMPVAAQKYPTRPIRMIVPFAPGGGTDIVGRHVASRMSEGLGEQVVVDNRGGGGGTIGAELVAAATPDGYTLGHISVSYAVNPSIHKLRYDPVDGISTVSLAGMTAFVLCVHPSVPVKSVKELVTYARANPARLNYGSTGSGGSTHLAFELFNTLAATRIVHIPYKGTGPALADLLGGQIQVMFAAAPSALPQVRGGRLRALAVSGSARSAAAPDLPTVAEAGVPGYEAVIWYGVIGPPRLPAAILARLNAEVHRAVAHAETRERLAHEGVEPAPNTPGAFRDYLKNEIGKWGKVARDAGLKPGS